MTSMYRNHGLKSDRFGEEVDDLEKKLKYIKNVALTYFGFDRNYIDFGNEDYVAPAIESNVVLSINN